MEFMTLQDYLFKMVIKLQNKMFILQQKMITILLEVL